MKEAADDGLVMAFLALLPLADPARRDVILRHAIRLLLEDGARRLGSRKDPAAWSGVRSSLRAAIAADGLTALQLATELGLAEGTVDKALAPNGPVPGCETIAKVKAWLAGREAGKAAAPVKNGHDRKSPPPYRLTPLQCEALAGWLALDPDAVRKGAAVNLEVAQRATSGQALAPEIVGRLQRFLGAAAGGAR